MFWHENFIALFFNPLLVIKPAKTKGVLSIWT
jgi:hypothetical protein